MARYQLTLAYDGANFFGSQRQAQKRTAQGELERALRSLGWTGRSVILSGRTDAGVHATGQVAACDLEWRHTDEELVCALNATLPKDMAIWSAKVVRDDFHPRFDAVSRTYRYRLFCGALRDPMRERFAWRLNSALDDDLLREASQMFLGEHDFFAFGSPTSPNGTTARTVTRATWTRTEENQWQFDVEADSFLYRMARRIVFVQAAVGQRKIPAETIAESLKPTASRKRSALPAGLAPACGLTLIAVQYRESIH